MTYSGNDAIMLPGGKRTFTSEGYLIAPAVLARSGILPYYARELGLNDRSPNALVKVFRSPDALAQSAPTFEAKPITVDHPPQGVDANSWRKLAVGEVHDVNIVVHADSEPDDKMHATLVVRDKSAIEAIQKGRKQLSNGYTFDLTKVQGKDYEFEQQNIQGNHIAIVDRARCGPSCVVGDRAPITETEEKKPMIRITMDGYPPEVDDMTATIIITKLQKELVDQRNQSIRDMADLRAELAKPPRVKVADQLCDATQVAALIETKDAEIRDLKLRVMTPDKVRAEYAQRQKQTGQCHEMVPQSVLPADGDYRQYCCDCLRQVSDQNPAYRAIITGVLDGGRLEDADEAGLRRVVNSVHGAFMADKQNTSGRNIEVGRSLFGGNGGRGMGDSKPINRNELTGRDAWVGQYERSPYSFNRDTSGEEL